MVEWGGCPGWPMVAFLEKLQNFPEIVFIHIQDIKIRKLGGDQFEIVSNTIGGAEEKRKETKMGVAAESTDDSNQQQQFDNTLRNFAVEVIIYKSEIRLGSNV